LKFHLQKPNYIVNRVKTLNQERRFCNDWGDEKRESSSSSTKNNAKANKGIARVLLLLVDEDKKDSYAGPVNQLSVFCMDPTVNLTLVVAFSEVEGERALKKRRASAASFKINVTGTFCRKANRSITQFHSLR